MKISRFFGILSTAILLSTLIGCGTADTSKGQGNNIDVDQTNGGIVAGELKVSMTKSDSYKYNLSLQNDKGQDEKLTFNSTQDYEYQIKDKDGTVLYTYSMDKMFALAVEEETLIPGEKLEFVIDISEALPLLNAGDFSLEAWVTADGVDDKKATIDFSYDGSAGNNNTVTRDELVVETVTYNGQVDLNSIEVTNQEGEVEVYRLTESVIPEINKYGVGATIEVKYSLNEDNHKVIEHISSK